ncbi:MAG TPA: glycosyltransferase [Trinickia sp.]|nr:glycosyltransferase [Trinickia sp.]
MQSDAPATSARVRCSAIIVNTNEGAVLFECLDRLDRAGRPDETIVVDNASTDRSPERLERDYPWVRLIRAASNLGYAGANDLGASAALGDVIVLLNPDAFVEAGWLRSILPLFDDADVGAVGPRIYRGRSGDILDSAGGEIEYPLGDAPGRGYLQTFGPPHTERCDVAYVSGAAIALRAQTFRDVGGLDEDFFCYYEETDLCWRLRMAGKRCVYEPRAIVRHLGSFSFGPSSARKIRLQTRNRIRSCLQNLSAMHAMYFTLAEVAVGAGVIIGSALLPKYREYAGAYAYAWTDVVTALPAILRKRRLRQRMRVLPDSVVLALHRRVSPVAVIRRYARLAHQGGDTLFAEGIGGASGAE